MKLEHFIPIDKDILLQQQIIDGNFDENQAKELTKLFEILEQYFHYEGFNFNKIIKRNYVFFDPDKSEEEKASFHQKPNLLEFKDNLDAVLAWGNYNQLDNKIVQDALANDDLIGLQLKINFNYFKEYKVYFRGIENHSETVKHRFFWKKEKEFETYQRVIIYIEYQDKSYFKEKNIDTSKLSFEPSSILLKTFKNVPKNDIETIFPNAEPIMSLKNKLMLWIPAIGGGVPLITAKVVPPIMAIYAAYKTGELINFGEIQKPLTQGLIALALIGAYLFRQYKRFFHKKVEFSRMLSESLYFRNIANNSGVFPTLIDAAEEEELKETILAYTFLLRSPDLLNSQELDERIERWFKDTYQKEIDFDVEDALYKLQRLGISIEKNGKYGVVPISDALEKVDEIWDNIFTYNK